MTTSSEICCRPACRPGAQRDWRRAALARVRRPGQEPHLLHLVRLRGQEPAPAYSDKYGKEPDFAFFSDEEEALNKVRGGFSPGPGPPLLQHCRPLPRRRRDPADRRVEAEELADRLPELKDGRRHPGGRRKFWIVPFDWGTSSVIYRPDLANPTEESWRILTDPQFKGKISFLDSPDNVAAIAGLLVGAANPMDLNDERDEEGRGGTAEAARQRALLLERPGAAGAGAGFRRSGGGLGLDVLRQQPEEAGRRREVHAAQGRRHDLGLRPRARQERRADDADVYDFIDAMLDRRNRARW